MRRGLLILTVGLVIVMALLVTLQRRLIYFPGQAVPPPPADVEEVSARTSDGVVLVSWLSRDRPDQPLLLVFPGNAGTRAGRLPLARALRAQGIAVLLTDYRGYGGNPGTPSEQGLALDAETWRAWADVHHDGPLAYYGESLGAGVATRLAVAAPPTALILRSPFTSLADAGRVHYPWLPAGWLLRDRFEVASRIAAVEASVLVVAGSADEIVPTEQSRAVYDAARRPKRWLEVRGAHHNDTALLTGADLIAAVVELLGRGAGSTS